MSKRQSCFILGYARSSFYKAEVKKKLDEHNKNQIIVEVKELRKRMPKLGAKKLFSMLDKPKAHMGRDKFIGVLRSEGLLVKRKKKYAVTTNSNHPFKKYENLILNEEVTRKNQIWVTDITYVRTKSSFAYVSLITDVYTRKIVGAYASDTLELIGCKRAFKQALKNGVPEIHHSDRGSQYCSHEYTKMLKKLNVKISMAEAGNCYENALAERINGILKQEFALDETFENLKQVKKALKQAVEIYNFERPHWSLDLKTPQQVFEAA